MKRFAETKHDNIAEIPEIVGIRPEAEQPTITVGVAFQVEHVRVAIGISLTRATSSITPPLEILILSGLNFICDHNHSI